jgi:MFS family permease
LLGHVIRFGIYAIGTPETLWLVILSNVVHGFAYAFFFATVYIFVDENFPKDVRTSAQSLFNLLILGLGPLASNFLSAALGDAFLPEKGASAAALLAAYHKIFLVPLALGALATLALALFFHPRAKDPVPEEVPVLVN